MTRSKVPLSRVATEFFVIVSGVLAALAADRWNQGRLDAHLEASYLQRLEEDVRSDSTLAEGFLSEGATIDSATDSLLSFVAGGPAPPDLVSTIRNAFQEMRLPAPATWNELVSTGSITLLRDQSVRSAVATYYGTTRIQIEENLERSDRRGRDRFMDALYPLGLFRPSDRASETNCISDVCFSPVEADAFRDWPGIRELLIGLDSGHGAQTVHASNVIRSAGATLRALTH